MLLILVFISSLLHSADMLQCLACSGSSCQNPASVTCAANQACAVYQTDVNTTTGPSSSSSITRSCFPTELCLGTNTDSSTATASGGLPFITGAISVSCCTTDNCNTANLTAPSNAVNGLKCSSCSSVEDNVCNTTLSCVGNQDRCFYDTVSFLPVDLGLGGGILKGCVSKNLCGPSSFIGKLNCCEGNLCNQKLKNLQCLQCSGSSCQQPSSGTCPANQACAVYQTDVNTTTGPSSSSFIIRSCFPTELCLGTNTDSSTATASGGLPFITGAISVSCCTTDNCNSGNLTAPSNAVNGLKCSSCSSVEDNVCNTTLSCVGNQDRCFYDTVSSLPVDLGLGNKILKGCVSKNLCGPSSFIGKLNCCEGNLCNQKLKNLQCLQCSGSSCQQPSSGTCPANQACAVSRIVVNSSDSSSSDLQRSCLTPELCLGTNSSTATASVGFAFRKTTASVSCCTTDDCNGGSLPEASNAANGLKCASCKSPTDTKCNTILPCVGVQDRCFNDSVSSLPVYFGITNGATLKGCVSKNLCGSSSTIGKLNCCEGTLCNKVENLQCRKCVDAACLNSSLTTCASNQLCVVSRTDITTSAGSTPVVLQDCLSAATCLGVNADNSIAAASVGLGFLSATVNLSCCSEDGCNNGSLSAPSNATNGLKCATCSSLTDKQCNTLLSCVGVQDRCFNESVLSLPFTFGIPGNVTLKGCVSKNLCGPSSIGKLTCCEGNLCNKSTTWLRDFNIGLLLMSLITAVFLQ